MTHETVTHAGQSDTQRGETAHQVAHYAAVFLWVAEGEKFLKMEKYFF